MNALPRTSLFIAFFGAGIVAAVCAALMPSREAVVVASEETPAIASSESASAPQVEVVPVAQEAVKQELVVEAKQPEAPEPKAEPVPVEQPLPLLTSSPPAVVAPYAPPAAEKSSAEAALENAAAAGEMQKKMSSMLLNMVEKNLGSAAARELGIPAPKDDVAAEDEAEDLPAGKKTPAARSAANAPILESAEGDDSLRMTFQDSDIRDVLELLSRQGGINILAGKSVEGTVSGTLVGVDVDSALQAVLKSTGYIARREGNFIYVGTPEEFLAVDQSFDRLTTRVYRPNYIRASDLQTLMTPLLSPSVGKITISTGAEVDIGASQSQTGGDSMSQTDVVIVRDYEAVLQQIDALLYEVDKRPRQVSIEATILSVKLSDQTKTGVDFQFLKNNPNVKFAIGSPPASLNNVTFTEGGLKFGYLDGNLTSLITLLETIGETNVVASPRLTCLNKQRAEIQIGEQLGYVSTTITETSSTQAVQFLDVGTLLRLRPFIGSDGAIRMEVHPELSTGSVTVNSGLTLPNKEVTQVTTNVMCHNGSTVILGGLIREDLVNDTVQVPILGDIPVAGVLFRRQTERIDRREILVLITPRIIDDPEMSCEGAQVGNEFLRRQAVFFDKMNPIGRRHHGLRYLRLARAAWSADDAQTAMKYVNLSIHHDPMNRESIALRDEIAAAAFPNESVHDYLKQGLRVTKRPRVDYTERGVPWKEEEAISSDFEPTTGRPAKALRLDTPPPSPAPTTFRVSDARK